MQNKNVLIFSGAVIVLLIGLFIVGTSKAPEPEKEILRQKEATQIPATPEPEATSFPASTTSLSPSPGQFSPKPTTKIATNTPQVTPKSSGAKDAYIAMRKEFDSAQSLADLEAVMIKHGSQRIIAQYTAQLQGAKNLPDFLQTGALGAVKARFPSLSQITIASEIIQGSNATLSLKTASQSGTAVMILQGNQWKLDSESWQ